MKIKKQAFTLVELIVVITILAILGTIAFISLQGYSANSRDSVRISDTQNMKTTLELFHLNADKYPLPDNAGQLTYSGNTLYYQGTFGNNVLQNVSRNMQKVPLDPLTEKEYIYSVSVNKNELEILALMEGDDFALNSTTQTNAAQITVFPKISGNYNGLFVKTAKYIVALPSIINTEINPSTLTVLDVNTIKSMVINKGANVPNGQGNIKSATGQLTNLNLSVYTGSLSKISTDTEKLAAYTAIYNAYTGSSLANNGAISELLSKTTDNEKIAIVDTVVLNNIATNLASTVADVIDNTSCKTILNTGGSTGDGIYTIDPDGIGGNVALDVYCDMTTNGGGYTLAMKIPKRSTDDMSYTDLRWTDSSLASNIVPSDIMTNHSVAYVSKVTDFISTAEILFYNYEFSVGEVMDISSATGTLRSKVTSPTWLGYTGARIGAGILLDSSISPSYANICYGFQATSMWNGCSKTKNARITFGGSIYSSGQCSRLLDSSDLQVETFGLGRKSEDSNVVYGGCDGTILNNSQDSSSISADTSSIFIYVK